MYDIVRYFNVPIFLSLTVKGDSNTAICVQTISHHSPFHSQDTTLAILASHTNHYVFLICSLKILLCPCCIISQTYYSV